MISDDKMNKIYDKDIFIQAHRGMSEELPENSIDSCLECIKHDISAVEIDIVISKDHEIVVSHDPYINSNLHLNKDNQIITNDQDDQFNLYKLTWSQIKNFPYVRNTHKHNNLTFNRKTSLSEVFRNMDLGFKGFNKNPFPINIELKSQEKYYDKYYPNFKNYAEIIIDFFENLKSETPYYLQSFDLNLLKEIKGKTNASKIIQLITDPNDESETIMHSINHGIKHFGIKHDNLNSDFIEFCNRKEIELSIWTINDSSEILNFIDLGINDFITDTASEISEKLKKQGFNIINSQQT